MVCSSFHSCQRCRSKCKWGPALIERVYLKWMQREEAQICKVSTEHVEIFLYKSVSGDVYGCDCMTYCEYVFYPWVTRFSYSVCWLIIYVLPRAYLKGILGKPSCRIHITKNQTAIPGYHIRIKNQSKYRLIINDTLYFADLDQSVKLMFSFSFTFVLLKYWVP